MAMRIMPFQYMLESTRGKASLDYASLDFYGDFIVTVYRVEMRRGMLFVIQTDDDS